MAFYKSTFARLLLFIIIAFALPASAATEQPTGQMAKSRTNESADSNLNPVAQALMKSGIRACANRAAQVINFLSKNAKTGAAVFVAPQSPDNYLASVSLEIIAPDQTNAYVTVSVSQSASGGCSAVYDAVTWWPQSCEDVVASQYPDQKIVGQLKKTIGVIKLKDNARVFLMPTSGGCNTIKKEIVF